jgi:hypothetical protein
MDLGFETIGNACVIAHDKGPVLATDPWLMGSAYFGSWRLSHEVPREQFENVKRCKFLWLSHGHPDHLSLESLEHLRDKTILLPDHHGGRIARDLAGLGFKVHTLACGQWFPISDRLRIASLANNSFDLGCGRPLASTLSLSMFVRIKTSPISALPSSRSSRPGASGNPSFFKIDGLATSASTNSTLWSSSAAMLMARLMEVKLLPSPGIALVIMIKLPWFALAPRLPVALAIKGRLITRY